MKILVASPAFKNSHMRPLLEEIKQKNEVVENPYGRTMTPDEVKQLWNGVDAIIAGLEPYTAEMLEHAPAALKVIARFGVGYDTVDLKAARARGIDVTNTPGANADAVADLVMGMMVDVSRRITICDKSVREGSWKRYTGDAINGKRLGIIGLGAIGKRVAKRARGFDMEVCAYDPYFDENFAAEHQVTKVTLDELIATSDYITMHVHVTPETTGLINAETLKKMKSSAYIINAARAPLVDEDALYEALIHGEIAGAAMDVMSKEPLTDSPLFALDNVVVLPHIGGNTKEATINMGRMAYESIAALNAGKPWKFVVNK